MEILTFVLATFVNVGHDAATLGNGEAELTAFFIVQSFSRQRKGAITPDEAILVQGEGSALRLAQRLSGKKEAVIAYQQKNDEGDRTTLVRYGEVPED